MSNNETVKVTTDVTVYEDNNGDTKPTSKFAMGEASTKRLMVCAGGIFVCYFCNGILQEKITKGKYGEGEHLETFHYTLSLVCVQCTANTIYAKLATFFSAKERDITPYSLYIFCSISYLGAMLASNYALQHVSYPVQVLGKSVKPIPVMIMGVLLAGKRYPIAKYPCILLIVGGVAMFMYKDQNFWSRNDSQPSFGIGEILLMLSLTFDGFTGVSEERMRSHHKTGAYSMMLYNNMFSIIWLTLGLLITGEIYEFIAFVSRYPFVIFIMMIYGLASAVGQMFIFITVTIFGPLTCSIVTTTRKFFTILASTIIFPNPITRIQWVGTVLVFVGLGLDSVYGKELKKIS